jgi:hypothetical protein
MASIWQSWRRRGENNERNRKAYRLSKINEMKMKKKRKYRRKRIGENVIESKRKKSYSVARRKSA